MSCNTLILIMQFHTIMIHTWLEQIKPDRLNQIKSLAIRQQTQNNLWRAELKGSVLYTPVYNWKNILKMVSIKYSKIILLASILCKYQLTFSSHIWSKKHWVYSWQLSIYIYYFFYSSNISYLNDYQVHELWHLTFVWLMFSSSIISH